jgi:hypothetical protein
MPQNRSRIDDSLEKLRLSPLFNLSLGSKELFHSDFLAWLCTNYRVHVSELFKQFVPGEGVCIRERGVFREKNHQDLKIEFEGGQTLLIENKVKSIPNEGQLDKYSERALKSSLTSFLLLSVVKPPFGTILGNTLLMNSGRNWMYMDYNSLAEHLDKLVNPIKALNQYHGELLKDYVAFIMQFAVLIDSCHVDMTNTKGNFFSFREHIPSISEGRIHDVVQKIIYEELAQAVARRMEQKELAVTPLSSLKDLKPGQFGINTGYSHGTAMFSLYMRLEDAPRVMEPTNLSLQVQDNMFRLYYCLKNKEVVETIADELLQNNHWFDFDCLAKVGKLEERDKELHFNKYYGTDLHRYKIITEIAPSQLVNSIVQYAELMLEKKPAIERVVVKHMGKKSSN